MKIALTIAGSDSGGGAGIQADLKTFQRFRVFGTTVVTAITAQNTRGVAAWEAVSPGLVRAQMDAVAEDLRPSALKSGMLATRAVVEAVAAGLSAHRLRPYVLDPVMVATSGDQLLEPDTVRAIRRLLLPLADLVTPNLDEAAIFLGERVDDVAAMERAARALAGEGARAVLVKGGHLAGKESIDLLLSGNEVRLFRHEHIQTPHTHGSGCTLSAAITAQLALGAPLEEAVENAAGYVHRAIATAPGLGSGHGAVNHWA